MRTLFLLGTLGLALSAGPGQPAAADATEALKLDLSAHTGVAARLMQAAATNEFGFARLARLCDTFGPRFSGSTNLEAAIDWVLAEMQRDGLANVRGEETPVPHWVRGAEALELLEPRLQPLRVLGLGGSIGTPAEGISAPVLMVTNFAELTARAAEARGRIVLFNQPFTSYGQTVSIRTQGAIEAARAGAVASLIRSVTPFSLQTPHTGMMRYAEGVPRIPHAAITVEDAELLARFQARHQQPVVRLKMAARDLPDATSRNVVAELVGREKPAEVVLVSGHFDSWDVGQGAMDDAGGCVAAWEAVRLMRQLELRPRRTVRVVFWVNEENGLHGARAYRTRHAAELAGHVLAIESDNGVFQPEGFAVAAGAPAVAWLRALGGLLAGVGATNITQAGGASADLAGLHEAGVPAMELRVDGSRYFWFHHTAADTIDKLNAREFNACVAALAVMSYVVADLPAPLPR